MTVLEFFFSLCSLRLPSLLLLLLQLLLLLLLQLLLLLVIICYFYYLLMIFRFVAHKGQPKLTRWKLKLLLFVIFHNLTKEKQKTKSHIIGTHVLLALVYCPNWNSCNKWIPVALNEKMFGIYYAVKILISWICPHTLFTIVLWCWQI